jgi:hypothetical protein
MIISGQMTRDKAIREMENGSFNETELKEEMEYVAKKLDMATAELQNLMNEPNKSYKDFSSNEWLFKLGFKVRRRIFGK